MITAILYNMVLSAPPHDPCLIFGTLYSIASTKSSGHSMHVSFYDHIYSTDPGEEKQF